MSPLHFSTSPWEKKAAFSRGNRKGNRIEIAGTAAIDEGKIVAPYDAAAQSHFIFKRMIHAVESLGGTKEDIIRTRIYITRIEDSEAIATIHHEYFDGIFPVTTMIQISGLVDPALVVEMEASAEITS